MAASPEFPKFKALELSDRPAMESFTRRFEPYSDFCFSTLFFYDIDNHTRWCWLNGNLVLRLHDGFGPGAYLTFLGIEQAPATADVLIAHAPRLECLPVLHRVPEVTAKAVAQDCSAFCITADRDSFDYVFTLDDHVQVKGQEGRQFRRDLSRFSERYPRHRMAVVDLGSPAIQAQVRSLIHMMRDGDVCDRTLSQYITATERCIQQASDFSLIAIAAFDGDALLGIAVGEASPSGWLMLHFQAMKADCGNLGRCLCYHMAKVGLELGLSRTNWQEDMGQEGLRQFKLHSMPTGFLRKYRVQSRRV